MNTKQTRFLGLALTVCICFAALAGCRPKSSGEEANSAMTPNQKALMAAHKDKQDDK